MRDETALKMTAMILATCIVLSAFVLGYDGKLGLVAIILLFGGEKLLHKIKLSGI